MDFIRNNLMLIVVALVSGGMLLWPLVRRGTGGPWVSAAQATRLINREDALMIDVREPGEYSGGHIMGAKNVPLGRLDAGAGELEKHKARAVVVYCDNGERAGKALAALKRQGFGNVANLTGGLPAWQQAGLPVERQ